MYTEWTIFRKKIKDLEVPRKEMLSSRQELTRKDVEDYSMFHNWVSKLYGVNYANGKLTI